MSDLALAVGSHLQLSSAKPAASAKAAQLLSAYPCDIPIKPYRDQSLTSKIIWKLPISKLSRVLLKAGKDVEID